MRREHYSSLKDARYYSIEKARERQLRSNFSDIAKPSFIGTKVCFRFCHSFMQQILEDYPLQKLVDQIDWNPFFSVWQLKGKFPNKGYPKIFNDKDVGEEAKKLHSEAMKMLQEIIAK